MTENPWSDIEPPGFASSVNARRIDAELPWNFFWARGADGTVFLTLRHAAESAPTTPLPKLRDIQVTHSPRDDAGTRILALKLLDTSQQDIFLALCRDILSVAGRVPSEAEAVSVTLNRTWRWHHLLRGGGRLLSAEEQKGLMGELLVLEFLLLPNLGASDAVAAWRGPLGSPKDFEIGRVAIEVKARRGGGTPHIAITSESQLDESGVDSLFLYVVELDEAPVDVEDGVTIADVAGRIRDYVLSVDPNAASVFDTRIAAAGLRSEDDYSGHRWLKGSERLYVVNGDFPRICWNELRAGVSRVRYSVSLGDCESFAVPVTVLTETLTRSMKTHGD